jgi:hypothetical protein
MASSNADTTVPDDEGAAEALPMSMAASMMLSALPVDAKTALERVDLGENVKGMSLTVYYHPPIIEHVRSSKNS